MLLKRRLIATPIERASAQVTRGTRAAPTARPTGMEIRYVTSFGTAATITNTTDTRIISQRSVEIPVRDVDSDAAGNTTSPAAGAFGTDRGRGSGPAASLALEAFACCFAFAARWAAAFLAAAFWAAAFLAAAFAAAAFLAAAFSAAASGRR